MFPSLTVSYDPNLWTFHVGMARALGRPLQALQGPAPELETIASDAWKVAQLDRTWELFVAELLVPLLGRVEYIATPTINVRPSPTPGWAWPDEITDRPIVGVWVPLTSCPADARLYLPDGLSQNDRRDVKVGQAVLFDGTRGHGFKANTTPNCLVSFLGWVIATSVELAHYGPTYKDSDLIDRNR